MNNLIETAKQILEIIALVGAGVFTIGLGISQFKIGRSKQASEQTIENTRTLDLLQKQIDSLTGVVERQDQEHKEAVTAYNKEIGELKTEVGRLNGIIQEKDGKLAEYKEIFQGRNPQLDEFIKSSGEFQVTLMSFMTEVKTYIQPK